jgi:hypothetical protein
MRNLLVFVALAWPLVIACADVTPTSEPRCSTPAPLYGTFDSRAPGYLVMFRDGVNAQEEVARLERVYGFSPTSVWTSVPGFAASLDADVRETLRCELSVAYVEYNAIITIE